MVSISVGLGHVRHICIEWNIFCWWRFFRQTYVFRQTFRRFLTFKKFFFMPLLTTVFAEHSVFGLSVRLSVCPLTPILSDVVEEFEWYLARIFIAWDIPLLMLHGRLSFVSCYDKSWGKHLLPTPIKPGHGSCWDTVQRKKKRCTTLAWDANLP